MAWIRQRAKNSEGVALWAATVRTPSGRRTESFRLKAMAEDWASNLEADIRRSDFIDPRLGQTTMRECWERFKDSKHKAMASKARDLSHWRTHVEPRWGDVQVGSILKPDVSAWVVAMETSHRDDCTDTTRCPGCRVGPATIEGALKVLRGLLEMCVDAKMIRFNPAAKVPRPPVPEADFRVIEPDEQKILLARHRQLFGDRVDGELFVELLLETGVRWEEAAALPPEEIDTRRQRIHVKWVMERNGTAREYPKSEAGNRWVGYGDHLAPRMAAAKLAARPVTGMYPKDGPTRAVFTTPQGKPLDYSRWLSRVWKPGLLGEPTRPAVKVPGRRGPAPKPKGEPLLEGRQPTPHDCRDTYGTHLADEGVPQHEIMALMGHKDRRASDKYIHAGEARFARSREALDRARGRTPRPGESGSASAGSTG